MLQVSKLEDQISVIYNTATDIQNWVSITNFNLSSVFLIEKLLEFQLRGATAALDQHNRTIYNHSFRIEQMQNDTNTLNNHMRNFEQQLNYIEIWLWIL